MTVLETNGITMPKAPIVWKAVAYAREMAPQRLDFDSHKAKAEQTDAQRKSHGRHWQRHQYDHVTHEAAVEALVGQWLTVRGSDDLSIILTYLDQVNELSEALSQSTLALDLYYGDYFFPWLVLQGQSVFEAALATPELVAILMEHHFHESDLYDLSDCLPRLLMGKSDTDTFLGYWGEYKEAGAVPDDFKGRLLLEVIEEWWRADEMAD